MSGVEELNLVDGLRAIFILLTGFVFVTFSWRFIRAYKLLSRGQKLIISALLCYVFATGMRSIEAVLENDGWKWTLIPYALGLVFSYMYLSEPKSSVRRRFGHDVFDPELTNRERVELVQLRLKNGELRDQVYELARRNNDLHLEAYLREDPDGQRSS